MLSESDREMLRDRTQQLLWDVGMKVESEVIAAAMLARGCQQTPSGRIRIPQQLIDEMTASQQKDPTGRPARPGTPLPLRHRLGPSHHLEQAAGPDAAPAGGRAADVGLRLRPDDLLRLPSQRCMPVDTEIFVTIRNSPRPRPEIGYISTWYRQDVPQAIERIDSLILGLKHTDKLDGIEAIDPAVIKYLKEISEIVTERPGDSSYLAGSECITSPLILERRSAADIVERRNCGIHRYHVASMPTIGVATPATIAGSVVMEAAEILGGMAACYALDPESDLSGRAISLVADMRNGNSTTSGPEPTLANLAVKELFDAWWGGHLWVEVYLSPSAKRPGLQAVCENYYGLWRYARLLGDPDDSLSGHGVAQQRRHRLPRAVHAGQGNPQVAVRHAAADRHR